MDTLFCEMSIKKLRIILIVFSINFVLLLKSQIYIIRHAEIVMSHSVVSRAANFIYVSYNLHHRLQSNILISVGKIFGHLIKIGSKNQM